MATRVKTAAQLAREDAGLTIEEAAKKARISVGYLRQVERTSACYTLACRLSRLYDCDMKVFLPQRKVP